MPMIEPEDFPNYPYPRRRVTVKRDITLLLFGVGLFLIVCGILTAAFYLLKGITWTIWPSP